MDGVTLMWPSTNIKESLESVRCTATVRAHFQDEFVSTDGDDQRILSEFVFCILYDVHKPKGDTAPRQNAPLPGAILTNISLYFLVGFMVLYGISTHKRPYNTKTNV